MDNNDLISEGLTFDDVLLVPRYSEISPPEVSLKSKLTESIGLNIPVLSAAMDKVTEHKPAVAMAQAGGVGVIHRNLSISHQAGEVEKVKKSESGMIVDPVTVTPGQTVKQALSLMKRFNISGLPVTEEGKLVGIVTNRDLRFEEDLSRKIHAIMTPYDRLITSGEQIEMGEAVRLMHKHRIEKLPIAGENRLLKGLITIKDIQKSISHPLANKDSKGRLRVGAAVGVGRAALERLEALAGVGTDFVVVDTAHGNSKNVIDVVKWAKGRFPDLAIVAGNVATPDGAKNLYEAGADAVKVGMGCGSICTTRVVAGIGIPQFTAIHQCSKVAKEFGRALIADGGIRYSGDMVKALAVGADVVMVGSLLAGTDEAPGELVFYRGRTYKAYRGMGSVEAMQEGSRDRYGQVGVESDALVPEGIEGMVAYRGSLFQVLNQLVGGTRAGLGYLGCKDLETLKKEARFVRVTSQGIKESHAHDVFITKEAPNYRPNA